MLNSLLDILLARRGVAAVLFGIILLLFAFNGEIPFLGRTFRLDSAEAYWLVAVVGAICIALGIVQLLGPAGGSAGPTPTRDSKTPRPAILAERHASAVRSSVSAAAGQLERLSGFDRRIALGSLSRTLPDHLSGPEVALLLGDLSGYDRRLGIEALAGKIAQPLSERDSRLILGDLDGFEARQAVEALNRRSSTRRAH